MKHIPIIAWLISLVFALFYPFAIYIVLATSVNLIHWRWTQYNSGEKFSRRVKDVLASDIEHWEYRLIAMEKAVSDIKEAQINIAGTFRGRAHP